MLIGKHLSVPRRIAVILSATVAVSLIICGAVRVFASFGLLEWPPRPSSGFGVLCGFIGGLIVLFEMLILPRKWLRGFRLGAMKVWMSLHLWLGVACLPIVLLHSGFGFGGSFTAVTLTLFLMVIASGIWGLIMQQWLPGKILSDIPSETVCSEIDFVGDYHSKEALRLVDVPTEFESSHDSSGKYLDGANGSKAPQPSIETLRRFVRDDLIPYLRNGGRARPSLASRSEGERIFSGMRESLSIELLPVLDRLERLCDQRRQWDTQRRLDFWLHNWLIIHLPLSTAMTGFMIIHAVRALKYW